MAQPTRSVEAAVSATSPPAPRKPRRLRKVLAWFFSLVFIAALTTGGWWWWTTRAALSADVSAESRNAESDKGTTKTSRRGARGTGVITMQPFVVNLADAGAARFLRVSLGLVVSDESEAKEIERDTVAMMRARSAILELLALQTADRLVTPQGKEALKTSIADSVSKVLDPVEIQDVLLTEFVVQF